MKVYVTATGCYSDYRIGHVFAREEDAKTWCAADLADRSYDEREVLEEVPERRLWYRLNWAPAMARGSKGFFPRRDPVEHTPYERDVVPGIEAISHRWYGYPGNEGLEVEGWDLERVRKVFSEQRAMYLARQEGLT